MACWSSRMIPASGAGGPGFNSRTSPCLFYSRPPTIASNMIWASRRIEPGTIDQQATIIICTKITSVLGILKLVSSPNFPDLSRCI